MSSPLVRCFFDRPTGSLQYVFHDPATRQAAIVDPVLNYDPASARTATDSAREILDYIRAEGLTVAWILDTHPHADHFSAVAWLADALGAPTGIGAKVVDMQRMWAAIYNLGDDVATDGRQWSRLFRDGDVFHVGEIPVRVMHSPGHTLASVTYVAGDAAFVHDTLMMPASGTSRADFPGGDVDELWRSIRAILDLPPTTRLYVGHDYPDEGDAPQYMARVAEHRLTNRHVKDGVSREEFVAIRTARDKTLGMPKQMLACLQANIDAGRLPAPESNGRRYLRIPLDQDL